MKLKTVKTSIFAILLVLVAQTAIFAQAQFSNVEFDKEKLTERGKSAYETLLATEVFTLQGFGAAAAPHRSTAALIDLLKEKQAEKALQSVVRNARNEGKIYALLGLQVIKSKRFADDFKIYKKISAEDEQIEVCFIGRRL
ncbi:MAG: hypothetical protein HC846_03135 [Blastocatellia bacterium]|nr:hypothetical protein [Blastocatellia bacterium]